MRYVDSLRTHGHRAARIDPLDILQREEVAALNPRRYGLLDDSQRYNINGIVWAHELGTDAPETEMWTLGEITKRLREVYVGRIAYEYMHSPSKTERLWFSHLLESDVLSEESVELSFSEKDKKKRIHGLLARSEVFDNFLQAKFPNLKRYGLEGGESMLPALDHLFFVAAKGSSRLFIRKLLYLRVSEQLVFSILSSPCPIEVDSTS
jgi:probable 2-oxoglutarate dehydrogenase E1 component DHKTD1